MSLPEQIIKEVCTCTEFIKELVQARNRLLMQEDAHIQWKLLRDFLVQISEIAPVPPRPCSINVSVILLCMLPDVRQKGIALPDWIVHLVLNIYFENQYTLCRNYEWRNASMTGAFSRDKLWCRLINAFQPRSDYIMLLSQFTAICKLPELSPLMLGKIDYFISFFILSISNDLGDTTSIVNDVKKLIANKYYKQECCKRLFFVAVVLLAIGLKMQGNDHCAKECIKCLRIYFSNTDDRVVTTNEIRNALYACLLIVKKLHLFEKCCHELDILIPDFFTRHKPITLLDYLVSAVTKRNDIK